MAANHVCQITKTPVGCRNKRKEKKRKGGLVETTLEIEPLSYAFAETANPMFSKTFESRRRSKGIWWRSDPPPPPPANGFYRSLKNGKAFLRRIRLLERYKEEGRHVQFVGDWASLIWSERASWSAFSQNSQVRAVSNLYELWERLDSMTSRMCTVVWEEHLSFQCCLLHIFVNCCVCVLFHFCR